MIKSPYFILIRSFNEIKALIKRYIVFNEIRILNQIS